jgi:hypothetical protein
MSLGLDSDSGCDPILDSLDTAMNLLHETCACILNTISVPGSYMKSEYIFTLQKA